MSRNAFGQIERDHAEAQALREHAAMERAQLPPLAAEIDSLRAERDRLRYALARIAAGTVPPREGSTPAEDYRVFAAEAISEKNE